MEIGVRCPWECDMFSAHHHHPVSRSSLAFFASPPGSPNDFSRHALNVPGLSALRRPEHAGISKQWNLCGEIEFITTLPAQITSLNGAAIRAMGFDFEVFYWCPFWISLPLFFSVYNLPSPCTIHPSPLVLTDIRFNGVGGQSVCGLDAEMNVCLCVYILSLLDAGKH